MIREEYLRRLIDEAYVDLYLSATDGSRLYWPWRMQPPSEATMSYRNACESYIIDSDPQDDDVTTSDVLDTAHRLGAEVASLQDVYQDKDATVETLLEGLEVADDHAFEGELLLPLQQPYVDCYREIGEPSGHLIGLGGLKDATDAERVQSSAQFRDYAGSDVHVHGFGWGPGEELVRAIRDRPELLDSLDYSTPVQSAVNGVSPGDERMSVTAAYAGAKLVRDLREVSPHPDPLPEAKTSQAALGMEL